MAKNILTSPRAMTILGRKLRPRIDSLTINELAEEIIKQTSELGDFYVPFQTAYNLALLLKAAQ